MSSEIQSKRRYELKKRGEAMAETRLRITEAAVELHQTVGPARTSISAVAERAGVQRHTVYRHFATEEELFDACSGHFLAQHPWPDEARWAGVPAGAQRLEAALDDLYRHFEEVEPMFSRVLRDADLVPSMDEATARVTGHLDEVARRLAADWGGGRVVRAAVRHAVDFQTWRALVRDRGLTRRQAVTLMGAMVAAAR